MNNTESQGVTADPEPTPACPVCHHPRHDWSVCPGCITRVDTQLGELLDLHAIANHPASLFRRTGGDATSHGARREPPLPLDVAALDLAIGETLLAVLEEWERFIREEFGLSPYGEASASRLAGPHSHGTTGLGHTPTSRNLTGTVGFLRAQWPVMAAGLAPPPEEFADEVRRLHRDALTALALTRFDINPDPEAKEPPDYTVPCPGCALPIGMHRAPRDTQDDTTRINCERCGWHGTGQWLITVALASGARPAMSLHQVREHYAVTERTVRRWVATGRLELRRGMYRVVQSEEVAG